MSRIFLLMILVAMSYSGIALAEQKVFYPSVGEVSVSTAKVLAILEKRRARSLGYNVVKSNVPVARQSVAAKVPVAPKAAELNFVQGNSAGNAPLSDVVAPYTANPVVVVKNDDSLFKHQFDEYTLYAGGWYAMGARSKGIWGLGEWTHWGATQDGLQNLGAGLTLKADKGWGRNGSQWGYLAPGVNLDFYRGLTDEDDILAKFRPMYRFGQRNSGSGFMPGGYLQFSHVVGRSDKVIASADGQYFRNDSYLGLALMWEHRFNKDLKVRFGPFAGINFLQSETIIGVGPEIVFDLYNRFEIGLSANFAKGGPFLGAFAGYKVNTDLRMIDANLRERSVEIKQQGTEPAVIAGDVTVEKTATGDYAMMPNADQVTVSERTIDQQ